MLPTILGKVDLSLWNTGGEFEILDPMSVHRGTWEGVVCP